MPRIFISGQLYAFGRYFEDCETQIRRIGDKETSRPPSHSPSCSTHVLSKAPPEKRGDSFPIGSLFTSEFHRRIHTYFEFTVPLQRDRPQLDDRPLQCPSHSGKGSLRRQSFVWQVQSRPGRLRSRLGQNSPRNSQHVSPRQ